MSAREWLAFMLAFAVGIALGAPFGRFGEWILWGMLFERLLR